MPQNTPDTALCAPADPTPADSAELAEEQRRTLATERMRYSLLSKALFVPMDLMYGRKGDLRKFHVLEVVARVPYQAWESVAEHEYMRFVEANPELDDEPHESEFCADYGRFASVGDPLRRIALDEREHKEESLARLDAPRFGLESGLPLKKPVRLG